MWKTEQIETEEERGKIHVVAESGEQGWQKKEEEKDYRKSNEERDRGRAIERGRGTVKGRGADRWRDIACVGMDQCVNGCCLTRTVQIIVRNQLHYPLLAQCTLHYSKLVNNPRGCSQTASSKAVKDQKSGETVQAI